MITITSGYYDNIVKIIGEIEQATATEGVLTVLEGANDVLGIALENLDPDRIADLKDSIQEKFSQVDVCTFPFNFPLYKVTCLF